MGGSAFPNLNTPRLSHVDYDTVRDQCIAVLQSFYEEVICPPEGPEKVDHGDVDLLVSRPMSETNQVDALQAALGAIRRTKVALTTSFAVPVPGKEGTFAQIDVHICRPGFLQWENWMNGYGDLVQIVGVLNRSIGITMTDKGLYLRIPEVETTNRKASMIFLSSEPKEVMDFLGLDFAKYQRGFSTMNEIFQWCAAGRFYGPPRSKIQGDDNENANDRTRMKKRPMFARFFDEWVPQNSTAWQNEVKLPRQEVLEEGIKYFKVQKQYELVMNEWSRTQRIERNMKAIREAIPVESLRLSRIIRGFKRWIIIEDGKPVIKPEREPTNIETIPSWLATISDEHMVSLLEWIKIEANYAELSRREKARNDTRQPVNSDSEDTSEIKLG